MLTFVGVAPPQTTPLVAPDGYSPASAQNLGAGTWNRIMYSSLSMIVWMVNRYCLNDSEYKILFHEDYSKLNHQTPAKDFPIAFAIVSISIGTIII